MSFEKIKIKIYPGHFMITLSHSCSLHALHSQDTYFSFESMKFLKQF